MKLLITTLTFIFISFNSYSGEITGEKVFDGKDCLILKLEASTALDNIFNHKKRGTGKDIVGRPFNSDSIKYLDYFYKEIDTYTKLFNTFCK